MKAFLGLRPRDAEQEVLMQSDVIIMFGQCMELVGASCRQKSWPEMFELLEHDYQGEDMEEELRQIHLCIGKFLQHIDEQVGPDEEVDTSMLETLDRAGWNDFSVEARTAYLAMMGLYLVSRVWVVGRQRLERGNNPPAAFDTVALSAGHLMRMKDQNIPPHIDGLNTVKAAAKYGMLCGLKSDEMLDAVRGVYANCDPAEPLDHQPLANIGQTPNESGTDA